MSIPLWSLLIVIPLAAWIGFFAACLCAAAKAR